jgi:F-type H+-transporting ATPase subunit b
MLALLAASPEAGAPLSPFEVNSGLFVWTWVVFALLFFLLKKYAWPSILRTTEERERTIARQLEEAERANTDARAAAEEQRKLLADARAQVGQMLSDARQVAERERATALERTKAEQDELLARARREIQAERERAVQELRREAVDLSLAAAGKLIGERLDSDTDRKLVMSYLSNLDGQH